MEDDVSKILEVLKRNAKDEGKVSRENLSKILSAINDAKKAIDVAEDINGKEDSLKSSKELANLSLNISLMRLSVELENAGFY